MRPTQLMIAWAICGLIFWVAGIWLAVNAGTLISDVWGGAGLWLCVIGTIFFSGVIDENAERRRSRLG